MVICKNGENCPFLKKGKCNYFHTIEERKKILLERIQNNNRQILKKPRIRNQYKGCKECKFKGCKNCSYRKICGFDFIPKPTTCLNDSLCLVCGKVRDDYYQLCEACGS